MVSLLPTSLYSGGYYNIPKTTVSNAGTPTDISTAAKFSPYAGLNAKQTTGKLLFTALNAQIGSKKDSSSTLSLSPAAQNFLKSSSATAASNSSFLLTTQQQQALTAILQKYQTAPNNQTTFNQIQDELKEAGISPDQLAAKDLQTNLNPTRNIVLGFADQSITDFSSPTLASQQLKANNYVQQIYNQFQRIRAQGSTNTTA